MLTLIRFALLGMLCVASGAHAFPFVIVDARSASMASTGVAADPRNALYLNPSLLATNDEDYDWFALLPSYTQATADPDDFESGLQRFLDAAKSSSSSAVQELEKLKGTHYRERDGMAIGVGIPSTTIAGAAYIDSYQLHAITTTIGTPDLSNPNQPNYKSTLEHRGVDVLEMGFASATLLGNYKLGGGIKMQYLDGIGYSESVDQGSIDLQEQGTVNKTSRFNLDVGVSREFGVWNLGLSAINLASNDIDLGDSGEVFTIGPLVRIGAAYRSRRTYLQLDIDLTESQQLGLQDKSQFVGLGYEYQLFSWIYLRLGYQQDIKGEQLATGTYGLGMDIAGFEIEAGGSANQDENSLFAQLTLKM